MARNTPKPDLHTVLTTSRFLHKLQRDVDDQDAPKIKQSLLSPAEQKAFPWLKEPVSVLRKTWQPNSKGLVYTIGKKQAIHAYTSIRGLRHLGSSLPVVIMYGGESDLPDTYRKLFQNLGGVSLVDMTSSLKWEVAKVKGYAYKPFVLFEDDGYRQTGSLFFSDRTTMWRHSNDANVTEWVASLVPSVSETAKSLRIFRGTSNQEQESAVVLINKKSDGLFALLVACALNADPLRDTVTYRQVWGDKETFWISFEVLGLPYTFMPSYGGAVGFLSQNWHKGMAVCGCLLHVDRNREPLWWNGGVVVQIDTRPFEYMDFKYYKLDDTAVDAKWSARGDERNMNCLRHSGKSAVTVNKRLWKEADVY
ncbi:hypothetical protein RI367_008612 [Sorochytrium milnesiophthora]